MIVMQSEHVDEGGLVRGYVLQGPDVLSWNGG